MSSTHTFTGRTKIGVYGFVLAVLMTTGVGKVSATDRYTHGKVGVISLNPNGDFLFHLEGNPMLCYSTPTGDGRDWVTVNGGYITPDGKSALLSTVTTAKLSGRMITVRGLNNTTRGEWGCRIDGIDFY